MHLFTIVAIMSVSFFTMLLPPTVYAKAVNPLAMVAAAEKNLVDLNLASKEQLLTLPGISETYAQKIIEGRPYQVKTQLLKKEVIPSDLFYGLVDKVTIDLDAYVKATREKEKKALAEKIKTGAKKVKTRSGLVYQDLVVGKGPSPSSGKKVTVNYTGWLQDGAKFDSSLDRGEPYSFVLGKGEVIKGWDEGIKSMKVGGKRRLIVPPKLAYGKKGAGGVIPPNATLIFEVELLGME